MRGNRAERGLGTTIGTIALIASITMGVTSANAGGVTCGNGIIEAPEDCDDGPFGSDCCSAACTFEPAGTACDDGNPCTINDVCTAGTCGSEQERTCPYCLTCDPEIGCPARPVCTPTETPDRSRLTVTRGSTKQRLRFKWTGGGISLPDAGDPTAGDDYEICISSDTTGETIMHEPVTAPFPCEKGDGCWRVSDMGLQFRGPRGARTSGVRRMAVRAASSPNASIVVTAIGDANTIAPLPWSTPLTVQVRTSQGACWETWFDDDLIQADRRFTGRGSARPPE